MNPWRLIETFKDLGTFELFDLWINPWVKTEPEKTAGGWRLPDCFCLNGKWFSSDGALKQEYITHWMPLPPKPQATVHAVAAKTA